MVKSNRFVISKLSLLSMIVIIICIDNVYTLNNIVKVSKYFYLFRWCFLAFIIFKYVVNNRKPTKIVYLVGIICMIIIIQTFFNHGEMIGALNVISRPLLIILFLDYNRNKRSRVFDAWIIVLMLLVIVDGLSMLIYPNGMYHTNLYNQYWFLGYKTERYEYSMPLCIMLGLSAYKKREKYGWLFWFTIVMVTIELYYSQATAAFVAFLIMGILCYLQEFRKIFSNSEKSLYRVLNGRNIIVVYTIILIFIVFSQQLPFVQNLIINLLHKDASLTGRLYIWEKCFLLVRQHPFLGVGYMDFNQFVSITGVDAAGSAHNLVVQILVNTGFVGVCIYVLVLLKALSSPNKIFRNRYVIVIMGIISFLIVGVSSTALFLSFFGFAIYETIYLEIFEDGYNGEN